MNYSELQPDEIYATQYDGQGIYIFRNTLKKSSFLNFGREMKNDRFVTGTNNFHPDNGFNEFRAPTEEELSQFIACEKMGKLVEKQLILTPLVFN